MSTQTQTIDPITPPDLPDHVVLDRLFGAGHYQAQFEEHFLKAHAQVQGREVVVLGTRQRAALDIDLSMRLAEHILEVVAQDKSPRQGASPASSPRPLVFIANTQGQALARHEELLGINSYFAHLARCVDLARRHGHRLLTLISGEAVSGGFLAFGLLADTLIALPHAQVRVMDLRAMSRVTKIPLDKLTALAQSSPVFAPGAENYWRMGALDAQWSDDEDWHAALVHWLNQAPPTLTDTRARVGLERGGRLLAHTVAENARTHSAL